MHLKVSVALGIFTIGAGGATAIVLAATSEGQGIWSSPAFVDT